MSTPTPPTEQAAPGVEVVLLTTDLEFRDTVMAAAGDQRPVFPVLKLSEALSLVTERQPGVLVTDVESLGPDPQRVLDRLHGAALDLVVLLAGDRNGGPGLMEMVDGGAVFRAILRPASLGQTGLAIEAAAERHIEMLMGKEPSSAGIAAALTPSGPFPERRRISLAAPVVGLALAAITYTLMPERSVNQEPPVVEPVVDHAVAPARGSASGLITRLEEPLDPEVERLLVAGEEALAAGRLSGPEPDTAIANFRAALELDHDNERAAAGLDQAANNLAAAAAAALMDGRNDEAASLVAEALALQPASPQLTYLSRQIRQEKGRALIAEAQAAGEANDWQTTVARLDEAAALLESDIRIPSYTATDPFLARAEAALAADNVARAEGIVRQVAQVVPDHPRIAPLERGIEDRKAQREASRRREAQAASERAAAAAEVQDQVEGLVAAADAGIEAGQLVGDGQDNALAQLRAAQVIKPEDPAVLDGFDRLTDGLLGRADAALETGDYETAERWIAEASVIGNAPERVAAARDRVQIARRAEVSNTVIPASELRRVRYVPPEYPGRAWRLGVEGWVDVEFDVTRNGETTAISVIGAERRGYFEDAVREAVAQWEYEPRVYAGERIDQRVKLRIDFERTR